MQCFAQYEPPHTEALACQTAGGRCQSTVSGHKRCRAPGAIARVPARLLRAGWNDSFGFCLSGNHGEVGPQRTSCHADEWAIAGAALAETI